MISVQEGQPLLPEFKLDDSHLFKEYPQTARMQIIEKNNCLPPDKYPRKEESEDYW